MELAPAKNDPWWQDLPVSTQEVNTDLCNTCGVSRDSATHENCGAGEWRVAGYTGTYDRIPDGSWSNEDYRDKHDNGPFSFPESFRP